MHSSITSPQLRITLGISTTGRLATRAMIAPIDNMPAWRISFRDNSRRNRRPPRRPTSEEAISGLNQQSECQATSKFRFEI
jgi:hypothetical protein